MMKIDRIVVVEGKYDKIKLENIIQSTIITTNGFEIFKDKEKQELLRTLAKNKGLVVLTDSDVAGFKIRHFLKNICGRENIIDAYIPDLYGKEKRKTKPSKEGKLGVEGVDAQLLREALIQAGASCMETESSSKEEITKGDFFTDGLSGGKDSAHKRAVLMEKLNLPEHLSANGLLSVLNALMDRPQYQQLIAELFGDKKN